MTRQISNNKIEEIKKLHSEGLNNAQIARKLSMHNSTVGKYIKKLGLITNGPIQHKLEKKDGKGLCTKCGQWKDLSQFAIERSGKKYEYQLSYCNSCRVKRHNEWCNSNPNAWWQRRYTEWKRRAKSKNCIFNLSKHYLIDLYEKQGGRCFYTDEELIAKIGKGLLDNSVSLDKIIPEKGYVEGNVVFCTKKINMCKNNLTLDEIKRWMPTFYERIEKFIQDNS